VSNPAPVLSGPQEEVLSSGIPQVNTMLHVSNGTVRQTATLPSVQQRPTLAVKWHEITPQYHTYSMAQLRHCATSRKVAGSIPDGVIGIFH
jgi:hypothetical protein